jgi:small ligand-binding sensory domain FIST
MIRAAVGFSTEESSARAALEAARAATEGLGGSRPDWAIAFLTPDHLEHTEATLGALTGGLGTPYVVGCSAAGLLVNGWESEHGPALAVLAVASDQINATPFLFHDEGDQGLTAGIRLGQRLVSSRASDDLLLVWPDAFHVRPDRLLRGLEAVLGGVGVMGGAASSRGPDSPATLFCGNESSAAAVSGVRLGGQFRHAVGITQGCRPLGEPLCVTRSHDNLILELDGRPSLEILRERAPQGLLEDWNWALNFLFVGLLPDPDTTQVFPGEYMIRNIVTADPDTGVVGVAAHVEEGQRIVFALREPKAARDDLQRVLEQISPERTGLNYRFGLYFNCLARGSSLYREEGIDSSMIGQALPDVPLLGFFSNAEIGPLRGENRVFTYTGVLLLIAE